jgi:octaprenyl-diphosphate synthase
MNTAEETEALAILTASDKEIRINDLRDPIAADLKEFRKFFRTELKSDVFLLDQMIRYLMKMKGKEMRPMLVLHSANLCGGINERTYRAATMIELLHTATLIHDDVVDESEKRRGIMSINYIWRNKASVLLGDFLLAKGLLVSVSAGEYDLLQVMSKAVKSMSEGELRQLKASKLQNMTEEKYFRIIYEKTASLIAACCESGAISATKDPAVQQALSEIGRNTGIAFQIRDDIFDYGPADVGKPIGNDIRERKITIPLIAALGNAPFLLRRTMRTLYRKKGKTDEEVQRIMDFVREYGGLEYATEKMNGYAAAALNQLMEFPDSEPRRHMENFIRFVTTRKK